MKSAASNRKLFAGKVNKSALLRRVLEQQPAGQYLDRKVIQATAEKELLTGYPASQRKGVVITPRNIEEAIYAFRKEQRQVSDGKPVPAAPATTSKPDKESVPLVVPVAGTAATTATAARRKFQPPVDELLPTTVSLPIAVLIGAREYLQTCDGSLDTARAGVELVHFLRKENA